MTTVRSYPGCFAGSHPQEEPSPGPNGIDPLRIMRRTLLAGSVLALTPLAAFATQSSIPDPSESAPRAPGYFDVMDAFEQWSEANGGLWRVHYEKRTQAARLIFGGSTPGSFVPTSDDDYFVLAREFLAETYMIYIACGAGMRDAIVAMSPAARAAWEAIYCIFRESFAGIEYE